MPHRRPATCSVELLECRTLFALGAVSEQIIVDQFGYRADAERKVVIFADPVLGQNSAIAYTPGATFQLRRVADDALIHTGTVTAWRSDAVDAVSGDKVWTGDFGTIAASGDYYVYDPANSLRSYPFRIDNALFNDILKTSIRTYFYQRSGFDITAQFGGNWNHPASHVGPNQDRAAMLRVNGTTSGPARDLSGGWYDAGDFNRYVPWTAGVLWDLLMAYEWNPGAFPDNTNIPESGNGVSDLLDEVKFELDWLLKMQIENGAVINRVGNLTYNIGSGPNADTQARYYTQTTTWATSSFAATLAHAARVFSAFDWQFPGYSQTLLDAASRAWNYLNATPAMTPASGGDGADLAAGLAEANTASDQRLRIWAAAELFKTTGQAQFKTYFESRYNNSAYAENGQHPLANWPHFDASLATDLNRALVTYATAPGATSSIVNEIKTSVRNMADYIIVAIYDNEDDPYRGFMWDGHYTWGSNQLKSNWANILLYAIRLNVNAANNNKYREVAEEYLHYFHGRNPLSYVYLTNMGAKGANLGGDKSVMQPYHGWFQDGSSLYDGASSTYGPAPGYLVGGPNDYFSVSWITPPYDQPAAKAFKDWNTGWNASRNANENSWEITEPAIYYQAAYSLLLSQFSTDTFAPAVAQARFSSQSPGPIVTLQFTEDVGATFAAGDVSVVLLGTPNQAINGLTVQYDGNLRRATVVLPAGTLPDGSFRLTLAAGGVGDAAGNTSVAFDFDFSYLRSDLTGDGVIDIDDYFVIDTGYATHKTAYAEGDLTYDGVIDAEDYFEIDRAYLRVRGSGVQDSAMQSSELRDRTSTFNVKWLEFGEISPDEIWNLDQPNPEP